jgi:hypothetical protein
VQLDFNLAPAGVSAEQIVTLEGEDAPAVDTTRTVVAERSPNGKSKSFRTLRATRSIWFSRSAALPKNRFRRAIWRATAERAQFRAGNTPEERELSLWRAARLTPITLRLTVWTTMTTVRLDSFQPSIESISEVQVITNQFSAEYGRASGGRVNIRTRAGSNRFRGRAFFFYRNSS